MHPPLSTTLQSIVHPSQRPTTRNIKYFASGDPWRLPLCLHLLTTGMVSGIATEDVYYCLDLYKRSVITCTTCHMAKTPFFWSFSTFVTVFHCLLVFVFVLCLFCVFHHVCPHTLALKLKIMPL